jgi:large-conductance mechanosensitive channel
MKTNTVIGASVVIGIVLALATGLINTTPNLVGATWYGWPTAWMTVPVTLNPAPNYNFTNLIIDIVAWFIIALIVLSIVKYATGMKK